MLWINSKKPVANYHRICLCLAHFTSSSSTCFHCIFSIYAVRQFQRAASPLLLLHSLPSSPSLSAWTAFWTNSVLSFARTSALAVAILSCHSAAATQHFYAGQSVSENPSPSLQLPLLVQPNPESLSPISELVQHYYELFSCVPLPHFFRAILFILCATPKELAWIIPCRVWCAS